MHTLSNGEALLVECFIPSCCMRHLRPARDSGAGALRVHLASCDRAKADIVRSIGFRREARLSRHFKAGDDDVDLDNLRPIAEVSAGARSPPLRMTASFMRRQRYV